MKSVHIVYRHVHEIHHHRSRDPQKVRPRWFSHRACFANLLDTIRHSPCNQQVSLSVVYDGTPSEFESDFIRSTLEDYAIPKTTVLLVAAGSNLAAWHMAIDYAMKAEFPHESFIYFLENDYVHQYGWLEKFFELCGSGINFDYASLYDHKDKYFYVMYSDLVSKIYSTPNCHWRTTPSTCGSFIVQKSTFAEDIAYWIRDTQDHFQFQDLFQDKQRILLSPIPGLSTHCMEGYLSPTIDWEKLSTEPIRPGQHLQSR
jgi:hypothetical protein